MDASLRERSDAHAAFTKIVQLQPCSGPSVFACFYQII